MYSFPLLYHYFLKIYYGQILKTIWVFQFSALTCEELGSCYSSSYNKKKLEKLFLDHSKKEVSFPRQIQKVMECFPGVKAPGAVTINW